MGHQASVDPVDGDGLGSRGWLIGASIKKTAIADGVNVLSGDASASLIRCWGLRHLHGDGFENDLGLIQLKELEIGRRGGQTEETAKLHSMRVINASGHDQLP